MINEILKEKENLLSNAMSAIMATTDSKGLPNSSYAPIAIDDNGIIYIYISELSKHTSNINCNSSVSIMVIEDESICENIFARKRITIDGTGSIIERDSDLWLDKICLMDKKFDKTFSYLKNMHDFNLYQIKPNSGLLVYGFGKAFRLSGSNLSEVNHLNDKGHRTNK